MVSIDTLIILLSYAIALCGLLPLFPWLEQAPRLIVLAGLLAGIWQDRRGAWALKEWLYNAAIVPVFIYYALQFSRANPIQPVVSLLTIMLAVRLAGGKSGRHYLQISVLALFCLASSSLFDLSPVFLVYLGIMLFLVALQLVLLTFYNQDTGMRLGRADLRKVLTAGLLMPLVSLPLLIFFFPVLPRTQLPLWNFLSPPVSRSAGFNDAVEPGTSSSLASSPVLVFRAEMPRQPQQQLYWRGTIFNRIEGRRWLRTTPPAEQILYPSGRISQTIYPEPGGSRSLPALDAPAELLLHRSRRLPDGVYEYNGPLGKRFTYTAGSVTAGRLTTTAPIKRAFYLTLPASLSPRVQQLADAIRAQGSDDAGRLEQLEIFFRNGSYRYSKSGLPTGDHALEQFLFESRQGHCEFFASSFALVLRAAGVPTRLVGGYLGGDYNQLGGYYLVTEEMAHVWVEVYIEGQGWLRVDPSSFAGNADAVWARPKRSLIQKLRMSIDSLDHTWNRTVISYDFERQIEVARGVGSRLQGFSTGKLWRGVRPYLVPAALLVAIFVLMLNRKRFFPSREERLLRAFYRCVERECGVRVERGRVGLFEIAALTGNAAVHEFASIYGGAVYRDRRLSEQEFRRLQDILRSGFGDHTTYEQNDN